MTITDTYDSYAGWLEDNDVADDNRKLTVLREFIYRVAKDAVYSGDITSTWANKKLPGLGVDQHIEGRNYYTIAVQASGKAQFNFTAPDRADALRQLDAVIRNDRHLITAAILTGPPVFTNGPEDPIPGVLPDGAPTTLADTLTKLREVIMLATVAGPKICRDGADELLAKFGLDKVPPTKEFVITRPTEAVLRTTVTAFDEATAERVAEWRWENGRSGYTVSEVADPGDFQVDAN